MSRNLLYLYGLAILAVVSNHAAGWGYTAMFWWTHRYRPVTVPNFDRVGTLPYYGLLIIKQLSVFSVPAFLFVSGFFVVYAFNLNRSNSEWQIIKVRLVNLLIPYVIWSFVIFMLDYLLGIRYSLAESVKRLLFGQAAGPYFYIPVICQLYLLSPFLVRMVKSRWKLLILGAASIQLGIISWNYLYKFEIISMKPLPASVFTAWIFYFCLGLLAGHHIHRFMSWLSSFRSQLTFTVILMAFLAIIGPGYLAVSTGSPTWLSNTLMISTSLYATVFLFWFLVNNRSALPFNKEFNLLGKRVYGIYLIHPIVLMLTSKFIYHVAPQILAYQIVYQPILIASAIGMPLILMTITSRTRIRKYYRYLFG